MRRALAVLALLAGTLSTTTGCSACASLHASQRDREAVANGYEVEREGDMGVVCELQRDGTWEAD